MDIKEKIKKIDWKSPRYLYPAIAFIPIVFIAYNAAQFMNRKNEENIPQAELSTDLGKVEDDIMSKNQAYDAFFEGTDGRTKMEALEDEIDDDLMSYGDTYTDAEKRAIDSMEYEMKKLEEMSVKFGNKLNENEKKNYYTPPKEEPSTADDMDKTIEFIKLLNGGGENQQQAQNNQYKEEEEKEIDPLVSIRKQMLFMDSLERARDPELRQEQRALERMMKQKELRENFLNKTVRVKKINGTNAQFNTVSNEEETNLIKAVIDENVKGYLGSRIRIRVLEEMKMGRRVVPKGTILYANISGFGEQRVFLSVVSIFYQGQITPINLSIYDVDGMKGLYIPRSKFREMVKTLGETSVQGNNMDNANESFYSSLISKAFTSTSTMIANLIRQNKVKLKYNSFIYLIDEAELEKTRN